MGFVAFGFSFGSGAGESLVLTSLSETVVLPPDGGCDGFSSTSFASFPVSLISSKLELVGSFSLCFVVLFSSVRITGFSPPPAANGSGSALRWPMRLNQLSLQRSRCFRYVRVHVPYRDACLLCCFRYRHKCRANTCTGCTDTRLFLQTRLKLKMKQRRQ